MLVSWLCDQNEPTLVRWGRSNHETSMQLWTRALLISAMTWLREGWTWCSTPNQHQILGHQISWIEYAVATLSWILLDQITLYTSSVRYRMYYSAVCYRQEGVDVRSCILSLVDLFSHWLSQPLHTHTSTANKSLFRGNLCFCGRSSRY